MKTKAQYFSEITNALKDKQCHIFKIKKLLIELKSIYDINSKRYRGRTLLHYAVKYQNIKAIKLLIKCGVNPEICDDDYNTPLHLAVVVGDSSIILELIKYHVNINSTGEFDQTPLHLAITTNNYNIVKILLEHGADQELVDERNLKPIDYAIDEKNDKIIELLTNCKGGN
ncbi:MAG: ankyrin repeat domain-containing protein [Bacilli bacterium]|nr:ankyrin repeat domain-containing protein [Bacilli bacterium]